MTDLYRRQFELFISDRDNPIIKLTNDRQFKITFSVLLDFGGFNTYADIAIFNVSKSTEAKAFKKLEYVALRAGYESNIDYIFKGNIINILRERQGPNTITRLICKGGALALDKAEINDSFGPNTTIQELLKALAEKLDLPLIIKDSDFANESRYISGYFLSGSVNRILSRLARVHKFNYLIDNEKLIVVGGGSFRGGPVQKVSAATGMVGIPTITEVGADVVVRLNPALKIGGKFEIESAFRQINFSNAFFQDIPDTAGKGEYRIHKLQTDGDSYGETWDTRITGFR